MAKFIDTENVISNLGSEPDRLRAEVGSYMNPEGGISQSSNNFVIMDVNQTNQVDSSVFSKKNYNAVVVSLADRFRDMSQWHDYINRTITTDTSFLDHTFEYDINASQVDNLFVNKYHEKNYEDFTKQYDTRLLANYNLLSYAERQNVENIRQISQMITSFDDSLFSIADTGSLRQYFNNFSNRAQNFIGSLDQAAIKQNNIFFIDNNVDFFDKDDFPFYYQCNILASASQNPSVLNILDHTNKDKNIFQSLKNNISSGNRRFYTTRDGLNKSLKVTSLTSLMTAGNIAIFSEGNDELFLTAQNKIPPANNSNFFSDQLNTVRCLGHIKSLISSGQRDYKEIIGLGTSLQDCSTYDMGFKIEKYIGTTQGNPIQTFYFKSLSEFIDTQFNYGVKYIYRIKKLIAVLGASYKYTNLFFTDLDEDGTLFYRNIAGERLETIPTTVPIINAPTNYKAIMNVEVNPSFQIVEILINENQQTFLELPVHPPIAQAYNQKNKGSIEFFLRPAGFEGPIESQYTDDMLSEKYFYGKYRMYRLNYPPSDISQFEQGFVSEVNERMSITHPNILERPQQTVDKETAFFEDVVRPHVKYYYAFKAVSYHGTESGFSNILELELLKDSDEYKINVKDYIIKQNKNYTNKIMAKRLIRIVPNLERLLFTDETSASIYAIGDQDGEALFSSNPRTFKIRIKSKHTGKIMDINVNFKIEELTP
tara:strand:- start:1574 stop:3700 length:2127 start_codon:yes stop_codon:yes gene_type:complete